MHICLPGPREPLKRDTGDLAPRVIAGAVGVFSQKKSDTVFPLSFSTVGGIRNTKMIFHAGPKKNGIARIPFLTRGNRHEWINTLLPYVRGAGSLTLSVDFKILRRLSIQRKTNLFLKDFVCGFLVCKWLNFVQQGSKNKRPNFGH